MGYADIGTATVRAHHLHQQHRYGDPPWTDPRVGNQGNPSTIGGNVNSQAHYEQQHLYGDPPWTGERAGNQGNPSTIGGGVVIGEAFGKKSIADVRELMALVDFQVDATDKLIAKKSPPPPAATGAVTNWLRWRDRWHKASDAVTAHLKTRSTLLPEKYQVAQEDYTSLQCAINKSCNESHTDPGDMREVMSALEKALGEQADLSNFRQKFPEVPVGTDPDLAIFKATDAALRVVAPPQPPPSLLSRVPWWVYLLGVVTVGGIGYSFYRVSKQQSRDAAARRDPDPMPMFHRDPTTNVLIPMTTSVNPAPITGTF
jgi:hypothetical protein